jgi:transposase
MRKHYTATFKAQVVQELLKEDNTIAHIAAEYEVHPTQLNKWKSTALKGLPGLFEDKDSLADLKATHEKQLNELYGEIGRLTTQLTWIKKKSGWEPHQNRATPVGGTRLHGAARDTASRRLEP